MTLNLPDFYHRRLRLIGVESLALDACVGSQLLYELAPDFAGGALTLPAVETFPLDAAAIAYARGNNGSARKVVLPPQARASQEE